MADVVLVLVVLAFFGLCVLYVRFCDRMIRGDETGEAVADAGADNEPVREVAR